MSRFSDTLMDHFQAPRNMGRLDTADATGVAGSPGRGRFIVFHIRAAGDKVLDSRFEAHGCGVTIACGSVVTELIAGLTLGECHSLSPPDVVAALDGIPPDKQDCAAFAVHALQDALRQLPHSGHLPAPADQPRT